MHHVSLKINDSITEITVGLQLIKLNRCVKLIELRDFKMIKDHKINFNRITVHSGDND